ncbi:unnamed protein product [Chrysodeixis includens]|uniref:Uncharacterized protein n=1 Tax=Chrysodeixis includens TaxID=689277 RepID=A0A9N8L6F3_CHRIL|nr:unnamed protein product [Chrysodeixis includens]
MATLCVKKMLSVNHLLPQKYTEEANVYRIMKLFSKNEQENLHVPADGRLSAPRTSPLSARVAVSLTNIPQPRQNTHLRFGKVLRAKKHLSHNTQHTAHISALMESPELKEHLLSRKTQHTSSL